jgi:hypothetical protein
VQLKIQRSQRAGGLTATTILFCLDVRADYAPDEKNNIQKYKLGGQVIYNSQAARRHLDNADTQIDRTQVGSVANRFAGVAKGALSLALAKMHLNISIASLGRGHHIECKDLEELLEAEDTVRSACKNLTRFLQVAETFDGSELVIEYLNGEEQIHVTEHAPPLLEYQPNSAAALTVGDAYPATSFEEGLKAFWANPRYRKFVYMVPGAIVLLLLLHSCFG